MSKKNQTEATVEDKALTTESVEDTMTKADYFEALKLVGVTPPAKTLKDELEKLYNENLSGIEIVRNLSELNKACLIKSFGDQGSSGICPKCKKKQEDVYNDCGFYKEIAGAVKASIKRVRKMGHRTGTDLWGTRKGKMNNKFCQYLLKAGEKGMTMQEAKKARWNPKGYPFNETAGRLVSEGLVELKDGRYFVTEKGYEEAGKKKAA